MVKDSKIELIQKYLTLIQDSKAGNPIPIGVSCENSSWTSLRYLEYLCLEILNNPGKLNSEQLFHQIGYIEGVLVCRGVLANRMLNYLEVI
jgi:hypothetical protein